MTPEEATIIAKRYVSTDSIMADLLRDQIMLIYSQGYADGRLGTSKHESNT